MEQQKTKVQSKDLSQFNLEELLDPLGDGISTLSLVRVSGYLYI